MATIVMQAMVALGTDAGDSPIMGNAPLTSGQTPNKGDVVVKASGNISECGADPTSIAGVMAHEHNETYGGDFVGASDLLQSSSGTDMLYYKADPKNIFEGTLSLKALAATDVGTAYGLVTSSGTWAIDGTETTTTSVTIVGYYGDSEKGAIGDTNARVKFHFNSAQWQE